MSKARKDWQLGQWAEAMRWYFQWLEYCKREGKPAVSQAERVRDAVENAGARRGLALRTRRAYAGWAARFAQWAGSRERVLDPRCAREWLGGLVAIGKVSYATQKQPSYCKFENNPRIKVQLRFTCSQPAFDSFVEISFKLFLSLALGNTPWKSWDFRSETALFCIVNDCS